MASVNMIKQALRAEVSADGLRSGADVMKQVNAGDIWPSNGFGVEVPAGGVRFKVNGPHYVGWVVVVPDMGDSCTVSFTKLKQKKMYKPKTYVGVYPDQLVALIDAYVAGNADITEL